VLTPIASIVHHQINAGAAAGPGTNAPPQQKGSQEFPAVDGPRLARHANHQRARPQGLQGPWPGRQTYSSPGALCGKCSIAYMQAFNERKRSALDADRDMVRLGDKVILWGLLLKGQIASKLQEYAELLEMHVEHHKAKVIGVILDDWL
jgi:hypothetical protein